MQTNLGFQFSEYYGYILGAELTPLSEPSPCLRALRYQTVDYIRSVLRSFEPQPAISSRACPSGCPGVLKAFLVPFEPVDPPLFQERLFDQSRRAGLRVPVLNSPTFLLMSEFPSAFFPFFLFEGFSPRNVPTAPPPLYLSDRRVRESPDFSCSLIVTIGGT